MNNDEGFDQVLQTFCSRFLQQKADAEQKKQEKKQWVEQQESNRNVLKEFLEKSNATCLALKLPNNGCMYLRLMRQAAHKQINQATLSAALDNFATQVKEQGGDESVDLVGGLTACIQEALYYQWQYVAISESKERGCGGKKRKRVS